LTSDKQILRRAIATIAPRTIPPYLALTNNEDRITGTPSPVGGGVPAANSTTTETVNSSLDVDAPSEGTNQVARGILALSVSNLVVNSLRQIPGHKSLVLVSGGLPLFDLTRSGALVGDIKPIFDKLTDNATRSGVVINTLDARGLQSAGAVAKFDVTPGRSALPSTMANLESGSNEDPTFGRASDSLRLGEQSLTEQLTSRA